MQIRVLSGDTSYIGEGTCLQMELMLPLQRETYPASGQEGKGQRANCFQLKTILKIVTSFGVTYSV